jgi:polar amino acid transport system substrate-binding protein
MYFLRQILIRVLYLCFLSASSYACADVLRFITVDVSPWVSFNKDEGEFIGVFPDIVREIERRTGHDIVITVAPLSFDRVDRELKSGRQDCTMVIRNEQRSQFTIAGEAIVDLSLGVIAKKGTLLDKYTDLYGLRLSVIKALSTTGTFMADDKLTKEFDADYETGLRKLQHGRLDAIAGPIAKIQYLAEKNGMLSMLGTPLVLRKEPVFLQCAKKSKKLKYINDINRAIRSMKKDQTLDEVLKKYNYL